ncbi:hypothetical protein RSOLAG1IB_10252 [Rhizoctonia solani AG-1 IB]|uniref:Uncharacterized protein n=1 Tax=Thanatephorus cucumeris (strain AG1-IB / isolate 7/3/14) TaxID=1108050 RepID=A0A0B7G142_THACB|nr:hypothetical protein RSOLAG1IB_10252 [Rhizoctonia solani AG-1 IB]
MICIPCCIATCKYIACLSLFSVDPCSCAVFCFFGHLFYPTLNAIWVSSLVLRGARPAQRLLRGTTLTVHEEGRT